MFLQCDSRNGRALFKFSVAIRQGGSYPQRRAKMLKWGIARDLASHPTKRVKVAARCNDVENELICDLASRKEPVQTLNVFFVRTNGLRLEQEYRLDH